VIDPVSIFVQVFGSSFGLKLCRVLSGAVHREDFVKILEKLSKNVPLEEALRTVLGDKYEQVIAKAKNANDFVYESDGESYHKVTIDEYLGYEEKLDLLRTEFNLNISAVQSKDEENQVQSHAMTIVRKWVKSYENTIQFETPEEKDRLLSLTKVLDPSTKTFKDIYKVLKPLWGVASALSLIYAVLLFLGIGMGILANISIFLVGVPGGQIVSLLLLSTILASLATIRVGSSSKVQTVIHAVYEFLNEKEGCLAADKIKQEKMLELEKLLECEDFEGDFDEQSLVGVVGILKYFVALDENVNKEELKVCHDFIKKEYLLDQVELTRLWKDTPPIDSLNSVAAIGEILNSNQKTKIFEVLKEVVVADGLIDEREKRFIKEVKSVLVT